MLLRFLRRRGLLLATVVIPTALAAIYFGFLGSDIFISESQFVVRRAASSESISPLDAALRGAGFQKAEDDAYVVQEFVRSRDAMFHLDSALKLQNQFESRNIDFVSRFPAFDFDRSKEAFHRYFGNKVRVRIDPSSSIITLETLAFSGATAHEMNKRLLDLSEALVNDINARARTDLVTSAEQDVERARAADRTTALAVAQYRNSSQIIDPEKQSAIYLGEVSRLQEELMATRSSIARLELVSNENPQLPTLRRQQQLLQDQIGKVNMQVAGGGDASLASKAARYQTLSLDREFTAKMLATAMTGLEQARLQVKRKHLYLERISTPSLPDSAALPNRLKSILIVFMFGFFAWGVLKMLIASVREHHD
jgi:capsular polysaccharide transport system permease protein